MDKGLEGKLKEMLIGELKDGYTYLSRTKSVQLFHATGLTIFILLTMANYKGGNYKTACVTAFVAGHALNEFISITALHWRLKKANKNIEKYIYD